VALDWNDLRYLRALGETGSLAGAAKALKVDHSTVSRRLAALEAALGTKLVTRGSDGISLNEQGVAACGTAGAMEALVATLERSLGGGDARASGTVRVSVSEGMAAILYRGLARLREEHPEICVELAIASGRVDLMRHEADIAIRLFRDSQPDLIARKVGELGWSAYAARAYVDRKGLPSLDDLRGHEIVGFAEAAARSPGARWLATRADATNIVLRGSSMAAVLNATRAGMGVAVLPCFLVPPEADLVRLTPGTVAISEAFLVIPPDLKDVARVKIVLDGLANLFAREQMVLAGAPEPAASATRGEGTDSTPQ
jgi:DNA-binding transcriptional LysR family regulator